MQPFRYHVYACQQEKPGNAPCCSARGSAAVLDALRKEVAAKGLMDVVQVTTCGSLGMCERGPNTVVYPEGVWYAGVGPEIPVAAFDKHRTRAEEVGALMLQPEAESPAGTLLSAHLRPASRPRA